MVIEQHQYGDDSGHWLCKSIEPMDGYYNALDATFCCSYFWYISHWLCCAVLNVDGIAQFRHSGNRIGGSVQHLDGGT